MCITTFVATIAKVVNDSHMLVIVSSDMPIIDKSRMPVNNNSHIHVIAESYA
jgi:hypothetical protein